MLVNYELRTVSCQDLYNEVLPEKVWCLCHVWNQKEALTYFNEPP